MKKYDNPESWTPIREGNGPLVGLEIELSHSEEGQLPLPEDRGLRGTG